MQPRPCLLLLLLLCTYGTSAQRLNPDSLVLELNKAKEDTGKVVLYRMLAGIVLYSNPQQAVAYGKAGAALGKSLQFDKGIAGCYLNVSAAYSNALRLDSALLYIDTAIYWSHRAGDPNRLALAYLNRADYNMQTRNLKQSLRDCDTALDFANKADNNDRRARILQTIGSVYYIQENYPQSQEYYNRAFQLYQQIKNYRMSAIVLNNIGNIFKHTGQHRQAIGNFSNAIRIADSLGDINNMSMYYGNLADAYTEAKEYKLAEEMAARSLDFARQQQNEMQEAIAYSHFGQVYLRQGKAAEAIDASAKTLVIAQKMQDLEWQHLAADVLAEAYAMTGDHKSAYRYRDMAARLNDSLLQRKYDEDLAAMQTAFKVDEKNNEILLLNKDRELKEQQLQKQQFLIIAGAALALLALTGIGWLISRYRLRQRMKELEIRNQIAADLHDEVGSSLSSIHMLSEMAAAKTGDDTIQRDILGRVNNYTRETMEKMGDIVWMIKPSEREAQDLKERMQRFLYEICGSRQVNAVLEAEALSKQKLSMEQRKGIYLVFKEAVNNAVKYAGAEQVLVTVQEEHHRLKMSVKDDGKGFRLDEINRGNGLDNMENRARELGGALHLVSEPGKGTRVELIIPLKN